MCISKINIQYLLLSFTLGLPNPTLTFFENNEDPKRPADQDLQFFLSDGKYMYMLTIGMLWADMIKIREKCST